MIYYWNSVKKNDGTLDVGWKYSDQHESLQQTRGRSATKHEKADWDMNSFNILKIFYANKFSIWFKTNVLSPINPVLDMFHSQQKKLFSSSSLSG